MFCFSVEVQRSLSSVRFVLRQQRKDIRKSPCPFMRGLLKITQLLLRAQMKTYSSTRGSLNTLEPVNGQNKRLFYCQTHEVRKHWKYTDI